jgi:hypothetical protein
MFETPRNRFIVDSLRDWWIFGTRVSNRDAPPKAALVFLHENEPMFVDAPFQWGQKSIQAYVESALPAGDQVIITQCAWNSDAEALLCSSDHFGG